MLKYILLGFVSYGPMTGYDLKRMIDNSTTHFWNAYHSQIYTTLRRLDDEGLLASEMDDSGDDKLSRRVYTLTAAGEAELEAWLAQSMQDVPSTKDELLVRVFFSARRDPEGVIEELQLQRRLHQEKLAQYQQYQVDKLLPEHARQHMARDAAFWGMTLRHGIEYETMYIRWLEETIEWVETL